MKSFGCIILKWVLVALFSLLLYFLRRNPCHDMINMTSTLPVSVHRAPSTFFFPPMSLEFDTVLLCQASAVVAQCEELASGKVHVHCFTLICLLSGWSSSNQGVRFFFAVLEGLRWSASMSALLCPWRTVANSSPGIPHRSLGKEINVSSDLYPLLRFQQAQGPNLWRYEGPSVGHEMGS